MLQFSNWTTSFAKPTDHFHLMGAGYHGNRDSLLVIIGS